MNKGLRVTLWVLSSIAVLWTALTVAGLVRMGTMMGGGMMRGGTSDMGTMGGPMMAGMILYCALTVIVMLGLDGVFVYLIVTSRRPTQASLQQRRAA